mmetsp:Transcript_53268/g.159480  ORF Transcript_53268/g.159480 Transcript_53268/m.159480 type:complete len:208 (+) Transcript_53268:512-1135(+)
MHRVGHLIERMKRDREGRIGRHGRKPFGVGRELHPDRHAVRAGTEPLQRAPVRFAADPFLEHDRSTFQLLRPRLRAIQLLLVIVAVPFVVVVVLLLLLLPVLPPLLLGGALRVRPMSLVQFVPQSPRFLPHLVQFLPMIVAMLQALPHPPLLTFVPGRSTVRRIPQGALHPLRKMATPRLGFADAGFDRIAIAEDAVHRRFDAGALE